MSIDSSISINIVIYELVPVLQGHKTLGGGMEMCVCVFVSVSMCACVCVCLCANIFLCMCMTLCEY